jgi:hypothetical protein
MKLKKKLDMTLCLSHGTCSYICMYINTVTNSVMLYLHDFYNIIFIIKHKLYIYPLGQPPVLPFPKKNSGCAVVIGQPYCVQPVRWQAKKLKPPHHSYLGRSCIKHFIQEPNIKTHFRPTQALYLRQIQEKKKKPSQYSRADFPYYFAAVQNTFVCHFAKLT